jgi:NAD(P)-dependent dehydrogenase (short-subunit alcohol dehydrogenase family)
MKLMSSHIFHFFFFLQHKIDDGQIVMLNSMSGHRVPFGAPTKFYSATKFAVTGLLEGWRQEVIQLEEINIEENL